MLLDQAKAHQALSLKLTDNLIPIFQPAYSPELNPLERLWQYLKQQIKGENFAPLKQLRERLRHEFCKLNRESVRKSLPLNLKNRLSRKGAYF